MASFEEEACLPTKADFRHPVARALTMSGWALTFEQEKSN